MKRTGLTSFLLATSILLLAQEKIRVKAGDDFSEALNSYGVYRFPAFTNSKILFRNGNESTARLNYNLVLGELQFINNPNDTLSIGNPEELKLVQIDTVLYYYDHEKYLEVVVGSVEDVKLAFWQHIKIEFEQLGAFEKPTNGADVKSYQKYSSPRGTRITDLTANQNRIITKETRFFLVDKFGKTYPANKNGFSAAFQGNKSEMQAYLKETNIHFDRLEDLKKLYSFCHSQLP